MEVLVLENKRSKQVFFCKMSQQDANSDILLIYPEGLPEFTIKILKESLTKNYKIAYKFTKEEIEIEMKRFANGKE
jgi:hypothetical protein